MARQIAAFLVRLHGADIAHVLGDLPEFTRPPRRTPRPFVVVSCASLMMVEQRR